MLVLSRKQQEQIKIGDQITVTIVRVKGNTVRVGIEAPRDVRVIRGELPKMDAESAETTSVVDGSIEASNDVMENSQTLPSGSILSFRVRCESETELGNAALGGADGTPNLPAIVPSAAHLPLKRIHDRFGEAPLKQLLASCATLAK
jgi:carbon storage regulator CsrA